MAFTPYVALTAVVPLAVAIALRAWLAAVVAAAVAVALAAAVLPRAFGGPTEAEGDAGATLRVLGANMALGGAETEALVQLVGELDVDLLSVEELTPALARRLDEAGLGRLLPHRVLAADSSSQGSGLYSRFDLGRESVLRSGSAFPLISARLAIPGATPVTASSVHTVPPTTSTSSWEADLRELPASGAGPPRILLGDFNATLDQDEFRELVGRGYDDAGETLGDGLAPTWPDNRRFPPLITIDHVLADERIGIREYAVEPLARSDHRAVFAELDLPAAQ